jgi:hypothetical protein
MTRLRRLATRISSLVARAAMPAAKDWAKASSSEMEFIESDSAALCWALGSAKVLFRCEQAPLEVLSGVPIVMRRLAQKTAGRARLICIIAVFEVLWFARSLWHIHDPVRRSGIYLVIAAMVYMAAQVLARRGRRVPQQADLPAQIVHYRFELERERRFHSGVWLWSRVFILFGAMGVFMVGGAVAPPTSIHRAVSNAIILIALMIVAVVGNSRKAANFRRRIEQLDALKER